MAKPVKKLNTDHIIASLRQFAIPLDELQPDPDNARQHPRRNLDAIKESLKQFGQRVLLVVQRDNKIVRKGNGTLAAMKELAEEAKGKKYACVAALIVDEDDLQATAFAIADNRASDHAEYDYQTLGRLFRVLHSEGIALETLGWAAHEVEPLLNADWTPPPINDMPIGPARDASAPISFTPAQREDVHKAITLWRELKDDHIAGDGGILAGICEVWLAAQNIEP